MNVVAPAAGKRPDVSIIVVHWNTPELLNRCLAAVAPAMAGLSYETIVVDNGSCAAGRISLESGAGLRVLCNSSNRGFAAAANQGAALARAELLLFLNSDVRLRPGCVAELVSCLRYHGELAALAATAVGEQGIQRSAGLNFLNPFNHASEMLGVGGLRMLQRSRREQPCPGRARAFAEVDWLRASTLLLRRRAFRAVCGFDEGYFFYEEDEDLCWRLRRRGYGVAESRVVSVDDPGGLSAARVHEWATLSLYSGQQRFVRRRGGPLALLGYRVCVSLALGAKVLLRRPRRGPGHLRHHRGYAIAILKSLWHSKLQSKPPAPISPV